MEPRISFKVVPLRHYPDTKFISCTNLAKANEEAYCVTKWGRYDGGSAYYDVWCICKNKKVAKQIAAALSKLYKEGKLDINC